MYFLLKAEEISAKAIHGLLLMFVILKLVGTNVRFLLNEIYVAGVKSSADDVLYGLPVDRMEYSKIPQKSGV